MRSQTVNTKMRTT